jgi:hypothetical protein
VSIADAVSAVMEAATTADPGELLPLISGCAGALEVAKVRMVAAPSGAIAAHDDGRNCEIEEASRLTGMSVSWLEKNGKKLPFTRWVGKRRLFSVSGIYKWNASRPRKPETERQ